MRRNSGRFLYVRLILLAVISLIISMGLCYYGTGLLYAGATDQRYVELADQELDIDTSALPEKPTVNDWYALAVPILAAQDWQLEPNLVSVYADTSCQSEQVILDSVRMYFFTLYFEGIWPGLKQTEIMFDYSSAKADVWLSYALMEWRCSTLDLSQVNVNGYEAFEIADRYAGQAFREAVDNQCGIAFYIDTRYMWRIRYNEHSPSADKDLEIWVNAITGEIEQR